MKHCYSDKDILKSSMLPYNNQSRTSNSQKIPSSRTPTTSALMYGHHSHVGYLALGAKTKIVAVVAPNPVTGGFPDRFLTTFMLSTL